MYTSITEVQISLDIAAVSRASFGIPQFITSERWFPERVRTYGSLKAAAEDLPTDSQAYKGLTTAFSTPALKPSQVQVARREVTAFTYTPAATIGTGVTITIAYTDEDGVSHTASHTTAADNETATVICDGLRDDLSPAGAGVTVSGDATLIITSDTAYFTEISSGGGTYEFTSSETAADMMTAITEENDEAFFVSCAEHDKEFVLALSSDIEARLKQYVCAVRDTDVINTAQSDSGDDVGNLLRNSGRERTFLWWHHDADTVFPEMEAISILAPYDAGTASAANNRCSVEFSKNPANGNRLNETQKGNLTSKGVSYFENVGGINITRGSWATGFPSATMADIRNRDYAVATLKGNLQNKQINTRLLPYTKSGIATVHNVMASTFDRMISTESQPNILEEQNPYEINLPDRNSLSFADIASRELKGTFTLYLAGEIQTIKVTGSMTYRV